jgi:hypothetical protein
MVYVAVVTQIILVVGRTEISFEELVLWVEQRHCIYSCLSRFEFHTTVAMKIAVFGDVKSCNMVDLYKRFGDTCCLHLQGGSARARILLLYPEDGGGRFLRNTDNDVPGYMAPHPKGELSSYSCVV